MYLTIIFIVSIVVLIVALFGLAFPKQFLHILVALKILKWDAIEPMKGLLEDEVEVPSTPMSNRSKIILATSVIVVVSVILSIVNKNANPATNCSGLNPIPLRTKAIVIKPAPGIPADVLEAIIARKPIKNTVGISKGIP